MTELTTAALFVNAPRVGAIVTSVTFVEAPLASVPRAQLTVEVPVQEPWAAWAETSLKPAGSVSTRTTDDAVSGPWFATVMTNVTFWPTNSFAFDTDWASTRSA